MGQRYDPFRIHATPDHAELVAPALMMPAAIDIGRLDDRMALRAALDALERARSVVGPSTEGGFYLVGVREAAPPLAPAFAEVNDCLAICRILRAAGAAPTNMARAFELCVPDDIVELLLPL